MNNPFVDIDNKKSKIPLQKKVDGLVKKKQAGRPRKPNMKSYLIKMDKIIHSQLAKYANKQGMNKSAVITQAVLNLINSHN